jgi:tetratricopeptide (TPR) repeat protein
MLAMSFLQLGDDKRALPHLQKATEENGEDVDAWFQYGMVLGKLQMFEQAIDVLEKVIALDEKHSDGYYNLGVAYLYRENLEQAERMFKKAIHHQEDHILAHNGLKTIQDIRNSS